MAINFFTSSEHSRGVFEVAQLDVDDDDDDDFLHDIYILLFGGDEGQWGDRDSLYNSGGREAKRHRHWLVDLPGHRQVDHGRHKTIIFVSRVNLTHFLLTLDEEGLHDVIIRVFSQLDFHIQQYGTVNIFSEPEILPLHKSSTEL